jgi:hypothetical protein
MERFRKMRADKSVSLNEALRQKEKTELKEHAETVKKQRLARNTSKPTAYEVTLQNVSKPGLNDLVKPKIPTAISNDLDDDDDDNDEDTEAEAGSMPSEDIILQEAQQILLDYSNLLRGLPVVSQR